MTSEEIIAQLTSSVKEYGVYPKEFEVEEEEAWCSENKYEMRTTYVRHKESGKYFGIDQVLSGPSTYEDEEEDPEIYEVIRLEELKVVVTWLHV